LVMEKMQGSGTLLLCLHSICCPQTLIQKKERYVMKKGILIMFIAIAMFFTMNLYGQLKPVLVELYDIGGSYPDNVVYPEEGTIEYAVWMVARPHDIQVFPGPGCSAAMDPDQGRFMLQWNMGNFDEPWSGGEIIRIELVQTTTGYVVNKEFAIVGGTSPQFRLNELALVLALPPVLLFDSNSAEDDMSYGPDVGNLGAAGGIYYSNDWATGRYMYIAFPLTEVSGSIVVDFSMRRQYQEGGPPFFNLEQAGPRHWYTEYRVDEGTWVETAPDIGNYYSLDASGAVWYNDTIEIPWTATRSGDTMEVRWVAAVGPEAGNGYMEMKDVVASGEGIPPEIHTLSIDIADDGEGTIEVNGNPVAVPYNAGYALGTIVELEAVPAAGWVFVKWVLSEDGEDDLELTTPEIQITMDTEKTAIAHFFEPLPPDNAVVVYPVHNAANIPVDLTFLWQPADTGPEPDGYLFNYWIGATVPDLLDVGDVTQYTVTEDLQFNTWYRWRVVPYILVGRGERVLLPALTETRVSGSRDGYLVPDDPPTTLFRTAAQQVALTVNQPVGEGTVSVNGTPVAAYPHIQNFGLNTNVTLLANPAADWAFEKWIISQDGEADIEQTTPQIMVMMNANKTASVHFKRQPPLAAINPLPANGATDVEITGLVLQWSPDITGPAPDGYLFNYWLSTDVQPEMDDLGGDTQYTVAEDLVYDTEYSWQVIPYINLSDGRRENLPVLSSNSLSREDDTLPAVDPPVWTFTTKEEPNILTVNKAGEGTIAVNTVEIETFPEVLEFNPNEVVTLAATPAADWDFVKWVISEAGELDVEETDLQINITMTADKEVTGYFEQLPPLPAITFYPEDEALDIPVDLTFTWQPDLDGPAPDGYLFGYWEVAEEPGRIEDLTDVGDVTEFTPDVALAYSTEYEWQVIPYVTTVNGGEEREIIDQIHAEDTEILSFTTAAEPFLLTIEIAGEGSVLIDDIGIELPFIEAYPDGTLLSLEAQAETDWTFSKWVIAQAGVDDLENTDLEIDVIMDADKTVTAHFEQLPPLPAAAVYPLDEADGVEVGLTFAWEANIEGPAPDGYLFGYWEAEDDPVRTEDLEDVGNVTEFIVPDDLDYYTVYEWQVVPYIIPADAEEERDIVDYILTEDPEVWTFRTVPELPLPAVALVPLPGAEDVVIDPEFSWEAAAEGPVPDGYLFNYWSAEVEQPEMLDLEGATVFQVAETLFYERDYNWQVVPYVEIDGIKYYAEDSPVWAFTTEDIPDDIFVLTIDVIGQGSVEVDEVELALPYFAYIAEDTVIELNAIPVPLWVFDKWVVNDIEVVDGTEELTVTMTENKDIVVHFRQLPPHPAVAVYPPDGETEVLIEVEFEWDAPAEGALPAGYLFGYWVEEDENEVRDLEMIDVGEDTTYQPAEPLLYGTEYNWQVIPYIVSELDESIIEAEDTPVWTFGTIGAVALTVDKVGEGSVLIDGDEIADYPAEYTFQDGAEVTLTAEPSALWLFEKWIVSQEGIADLEILSEETIITMDEDKQAVAHFVPMPPLAATAVAPADGAVDQLIDLTFEWTPNNGTAPVPDGYYFNYWLASAPQPVMIDVGADTSYGVTGLVYEAVYNWQVIPYIEIDEDRIEAVDCPVWSFTTEDAPAGVYSLTVDIDGEGSVEVNGTVITSFPYQANFTDNTQVTLIAEAAEFWAFDKWVVDGVDDFDEEVLLTITANTVAIAHFEQVPPLPALAIFPGDGDTDVPVDLTFQWEHDPAGSPPHGYFFNYWLASDTEPVMIDVGTETTYQVPEPLEFDTEYEWQVIPYVIIDEEVVEIENCPVWSFTTEEELYTLTVLIEGEGAVEVDEVLVTEFPAEFIRLVDSTVELLAIPNADWGFEKWVIDGVEEFAAETEIVITADATATAHFYEMPLAATAIYPPEDETDVMIDLTFEWEANVEGAEPEGYLFAYWVAGNDLREMIDVGEATTYEAEGLEYDTLYNWEVIPYITINEERVEAVDTPVWAFTTIAQYTLTIAVAGEGTTEPEAGEHLYLNGSIVNIEAFPAEGWAFEKWVINGTEDYEAATEIMVDADLTATAHFYLLPLPAAVIYPEEDEMGVLTELTFEWAYSGEGAVPDGYLFNYWIEGEEEPVMMDLSDETTYQAAGLEYFTLYNWQVIPYVIVGEAYVEAEDCPVWSFTTIETFALEIVVEGEGVTVPEPGIHIYEDGTVVDLAAVPAENWGFKKWVIDGVDILEVATEVVMTSNVTATAHFYLLPLPAFAVNPQDGETDLMIDLTFEWEADLSGAEPEGYLFNYWITGDESREMIDVGANTTYEVEGLEYATLYNWQVVPYITINDEQIQAADIPVWEFTTIAQYALNIVIVGEGTTVPEAGENLYLDGDLVELFADPAEHWGFEKWVIGDEEIFAPEAELQITADLTATAYFYQLPPYPAVAVYPEDGAIEIPVDMSFDWNASDQGPPADGFLFAYWSSEEDVPEMIDLGELTAYTPEDLLLYNSTYHWQVVPYIYKWDDNSLILAENSPVWTFDSQELYHPLTVDIVGYGSVIVDGVEVSAYQEFEIADATTVEFNAVPDTHWEFEKWIVNGVEVFDQAIEVLMIEEVTVTAYFYQLPPLPATVVYPADGAENLPIHNINFQWTASTEGPTPDGYMFGYWADDEEMLDIGNVTSYQITEPLDYDTEYFWQVIPYVVSLTGERILLTALSRTVREDDYIFAEDCPVWSFETVVPLPDFYEPFDAVTTPLLPAGWTSIVQSTSVNAFVKTWAGGTGANSPVTPPNQVQMSTGPNHLMDLMLITPPVDNFADNYLRFWAKFSLPGRSGNVVVGVMSNPHDAATFQAVETIYIEQNSVYRQYGVEFPSATEAQHIAFKLQADQNYSVLILDDVEWQAAPVVPNPPQNLSAQAGIETITLEWSPPAGTNRHDLRNTMGYNVYRNGVLINPQPLTETSYEDTDVVNFVNYTYYVTTITHYGIYGESNPSNTVQASPYTLVPPHGLSAAAGENEVFLSWQAPDLSPPVRGTLSQTRAGNERELRQITLTGYNIYRNGSVIFTQTSANTTYTDSNVQGGTTYQYYVTAVYNHGESQASNTVQVTPYTLHPPRNLAAVAGENRVSLNWRAPLPQRVALQGYNIYRNGTLINPTIVTNAQYVDLGVESGVTYQYYVTAVYNVGESNASNQVEATPFAFIPPHNLSAAGGENLVALAWEEPTGHGLTVSGYKVYRNGQLIHPLLVTETEYEDSGVTGGVTYEYFVRAVYAAGTSAPSNVVEATPYALYPPQNLSGSAGEMMNILSWEEPMPHGADLIGYNVYRNEIMISADPVTETEYEDSDVVAGETYTYYVTAVYEQGESSPSNMVNITTVDADDVTITPLVTELRGNYPNPFNPDTTIKFTLESDEFVILEIYNSRGQMIRSLVNEFKQAGEHQVFWNGRDEQNRNVASGVYFYRMKSGRYTSTKKMLMMK